jgi:hypothetical protein
VDQLGPQAVTLAAGAVLFVIAAIAIVGLIAQAP